MMCPQSRLTPGPAGSEGRAVLGTIMGQYDSIHEPSSKKCQRLEVQLLEFEWWQILQLIFKTPFTNLIVRTKYYGQTSSNATWLQGRN